MRNTRAFSGSLMKFYLFWSSEVLMWGVVARQQKIRKSVMTEVRVSESV